MGSLDELSLPRYIHLISKKSLTLSFAFPLINLYSRRLWRMRCYAYPCLWQPFRRQEGYDVSSWPRQSARASWSNGRALSQSQHSPKTTNAAPSYFRHRAQNPLNFSLFSVIHVSMNYDIRAMPLWAARTRKELQAVVGESSASLDSIDDLRRTGRASFVCIDKHDSSTAPLSVHRANVCKSLLCEAMTRLTHSGTRGQIGSGQCPPHGPVSEDDYYSLVDEPCAILSAGHVSAELAGSATALAVVALLDLAYLFGPHSIDSGPARTLARAAAHAAASIPLSHVLQLTRIRPHLSTAAPDASSWADPALLPTRLVPSVAASATPHALSTLFPGSSATPTPVLLTGVAAAWGWRIDTWSAPPAVDAAQTELTAVGATAAGATDTSAAALRSVVPAPDAADTALLRSCPLPLAALASRVLPAEPADTVYTDRRWRNRLVRGASVLRGLTSEGVLAPNSAHARLYLAQHPLLSQVPSLAVCFPPPDMCALPPPSDRTAGRRTGAHPGTAREPPQERGVMRPAIASSGPTPARPRLVLPAPRGTDADATATVASAVSLSFAATCVAVVAKEEDGPSAKRPRIAGGDGSASTAACIYLDRAPFSRSGSGRVNDITDTGGPGRDVIVTSNCWIGPAGTVSPLHTVRLHMSPFFSPSDMLFAQVIKLFTHSTLLFFLSLFHPTHLSAGP
jgi:hypothetical protein